MTVPPPVRRGDVWVADLHPRFGAEPGKVRPVVVVQSDLLNPHHTSTLVCPVTTKLAREDNLMRVRLKAGEGGVTKKSDVMVDQVRSIDNSRFRKPTGKLEAGKLAELKEKLHSIMDLD